MSQPEAYEVFALRYAEVRERTRRENLVQADLHDQPMPIDFFVWVIRNGRRTVLVDTGFERREGERRGRAIIRLPREALAMVGVEAQAVRDVVVTHLHFDHAGTLDDFSGATFHLQDREMAYATGRCMCFEHMRAPFTADHVCAMVRRVFDGRVRFHDGASQLAPGIELHHVGGHSAGLQVVRVLTRRGWIVLASDAAHFYENYERRAPFPIIHSLADMVQGFETLDRLADSPRHVVPGHDPLVRERYPSPREDMRDVVCRLDADPAG